MAWSKEDTERVRAAYKEALEFMGRYEDEEVLKSALFMREDKIPDPDDVIHNLYELSRNHTNTMIFLEKAEHTAIEGPMGINLTLHSTPKIGWFDYTLDDSERVYSPEDRKISNWLVDDIRKKALIDHNNGKLNNSNKRKNITWALVEQAVDKVSDKLLNGKDKYKGHGTTLIFDMVAEELSILLQAQGKPAIKSKTLYRWIQDEDKERQDVFDLFSDKAMRIIKNT